jgi:hypothetical protein
MNPWPFVVAAYVAVLIGGGALLIWSFVAMRRAAARAAETTRR